MDVDAPVLMHQAVRRTSRGTTGREIHWQRHVHFAFCMDVISVVNDGARLIGLLFHILLAIVYAAPAATAAASRVGFRQCT